MGEVSPYVAIATLKARSLSVFLSLSLSLSLSSPFVSITIITGDKLLPEDLSSTFSSHLSSDLP